ncbi:MAG: DUF2157 domain-containing protein [Nannocystaceae bacterium]
MSLDARLARWVAHGLLDAAQVEPILEFERQKHRPLFLYAVAGLGGLAIAIGLLSIVAANWDEIPGGVKLGLDLALVGGLGYATARWHERGPSWAFETALLVLYGLVMASIALIGQVYQLGGQAREALGAWTLMTALLMTRGRSTIVATTWLLGLQVTYAAWLAWVADGPLDAEALALSAVYWAPLVCLVVGTSRWVARRRPALAGVFAAIAWAELVLCASVGTLAFYGDGGASERAGLLPGLGVSAMLTGWLWTRLPKTSAGQASRWLLVTCLALSHGPFLLGFGKAGVLAALSFIGLWVLVAFAAHRSGDMRVLNFATAVVGLRVLIVYFEVFGSLLGTGVGLVSGGLLTLALVWLWVRTRRDLARDRDEALEEST